MARSTTSQPRHDRASSPRTGEAMLSHPHKRLFEAPPLSKEQLAGYYRQVAPHLLADIGGRPLSIVRCPDGIDKDCFFQKHAGGGLPAGIHTLPVEDNRGHSEYLWLDHADGLLDIVQLGGIELHPWSCRVNDVEHADRVVFDLDPGPGIGFGEVRRTARELRARLAALGLESYVRTTGGKGLHVVAPIMPGPDWDTVRDFAHGVARAMYEAAPERFLAVADRSRREGRIFIDYLRNGRGATAIGNYSVRARRGAPVAVPLRWDELSRVHDGAQYNVGNVPHRLRQLESDPWHGIGRARRELPDPARAQTRGR